MKRAIPVMLIVLIVVVFLQMVHKHRLIKIITMLWLLMKRLMLLAMNPV